MPKKKFEFVMDPNGSLNKNGNPVPSKDRELIGKLFTIIDEEHGELKARLVDIKPPEGYYTFKITTKDSELDEVSCRYPNEMMEVYK